ncbi:Carboxypeptidase regulatory-like domain protein [Candidatus Gugararchaeum adminiculabundum]|nr:Carboxypeptidase regulatory-like domain protein [Candidatus Gugararchaeum adminiculabundum]
MKIENKFVKIAVAVAALLLLAGSLVFAGSWAVKVTDASTGLVISGANVTATVTATGAYAGSNLTDLTGYANISGLGDAAGIQYTLNATNAGYMHYERNHPAIRDTQDLVSPITLTMSPSLPSNITGKITNSSASLDGATISVYNINTGALVSSNASNANGDYNITGLLSPAFYNINVTAPYHVSAGTTNVYLDSNAILAKNFQLVYIPGNGNVTGTVTLLNGTVFPGATVKVYRFIGGTQVGSSATTDTNGNYAITGILPGTYTVNVTKTNYAPTAIGPIEVRDYQNTTVDFNTLYPANVTAISINPSSATTRPGNSVTFGASATDQFGDAIPISGVNWSVSGSIGTISSTSGIPSLTTIFTSSGTGTVTLTANYNGITRTATISSVSPNPGNIVVGGPGQIYPPAATISNVTPEVKPPVTPSNVTPEEKPPMPQTKEITVTIPAGLVTNTPATFIAMRIDGTPVQGSNIQFYGPSGEQVTLPTDNEGKVVFTPKSAGVYSYSIPGFSGESSGTFSVTAPATSTGGPKPVLVPAKQNPETVQAPSALFSPVDSIVNFIRNNLPIIGGAAAIILLIIGALAYNYFGKGGKGGYHGGSSSAKAETKGAEKIPEVKYSSKPSKYKPLGKSE